LLVNNDVEIFNDALIKLIEVSKSSNRKAIVSSLTISADDKKTVLKTGTLVKSWFLNKTEHLFKDTNIDKILNKNPVHVHFLTARCLLHTVEIFSFTGNYDNSTFPHYGGDDEFSMRIKKFGYSTIQCPSSIVFLRSNEKVLLKKTYSKFFFMYFLVLNQVQT
jgi:GT2 family glycosyltransferase